MPHIDVYAPAERNVYYNTAAESHFKIGEYDKAIPFYEKQILVCRKEEKADALYRLGFCHMFLEEWGKAAETFMSAAACYRAFPTSVSMGRLKQPGQHDKRLPAKGRESACVSWPFIKRKAAFCNAKSRLLGIGEK